MTAEKIKDDKAVEEALVKKLDHAKEIYNYSRKALDDFRNKRCRQCDHCLPDGTGAGDGGFAYQRCTICGEFDV